MDGTPISSPRRVVVLCGGVGGAKLVDGLAQVVDGAQLTVIVNTADDFRHYGLHISPDVDTVIYTLAGRANPVTGWGIASDTRLVMDAVARIGEAPWFLLGDQDLATHLVRTQWLDAGTSLTEVTIRLSERLGVTATVLPMSDDAVATVIATADGDLPFQEWFVRRRCTPPADGVRYDGAAAARPSPGVIEALGDADVIVLAPSNPYLSIAPILAVPGIRDRCRGAGAPVVAVSPIVGGRAIKGPAADLLTRLAGEASSRALAHLYVDFLDGMVIDRVDAGEAVNIVSTGVGVRVSDTLMRESADRVRLARETLGFAASLASSRLARDG